LHKETPVEGIGARIGFKGPEKRCDILVPMPRRKKSRVHPKYKTKYRVTNWPEYDRALARRGSQTPCWDFDRQEIARGHS